MQRFSRIRTVVNRFCGYLAQVELLSGYTEIDKKWLEIYSTKKPTNTEDPFTSSSPIHISLDGEDTSSTPKTVERHVGRKLAKEGRTKRNGKFVYDRLIVQL